MSEFDGPIPELGLRCPHCGAALAGLDHRVCPACGQRFNYLSMLADLRPIPDIGLTCASCDYPLTGLIEERCPECGTGFRVRDMLEANGEPPVVAIRGPASVSQGMVGFEDPSDHRLKRREPTFTGRESPLPDFGLICSACEFPLAGSTEDLCRSCGKPFNLGAIAPGQEWVRLKRLMPRELAGIARMTLYQAQVPYMVEGGAVRDLYHLNLGSPEVLVPRAFLLDALHALAAAAGPAQETAGQHWQCSTCAEAVPAHFEVCWNCQADRPADAALVTAPPARTCVQCGEELGENEADCASCGTPAAQRDEEEDEGGTAGWVCPHCGMRVPDGFEICWKCQGGPGHEIPSPVEPIGH